VTADLIDHAEGGGHMGNNRMKSVWFEKQKAEDRLNKVRSKKTGADRKEEQPHVESSTDNSSGTGNDNSDS
jgi:hypothetical protein